MKISGISVIRANGLGFSANRRKNKRREDINGIHKRIENNDVFLKTIPNNIERTYYKNGAVSSETKYKKGEWFKETWYDMNGMTSSVHYSGGRFNLSRNTGRDWEKSPCIDFTRKENGNTIILHVRPAVFAKDGSNGRLGGFSLDILNKNNRILSSNLFMYPDGSFKYYNDHNLNELKDELSNLYKIIFKNEFRDFSSSHKLNKSIKGAIRYLETRCEQD